SKRGQAQEKPKAQTTTYISTDINQPEKPRIGHTASNHCPLPQRLALRGLQHLTPIIQQQIQRLSDTPQITLISVQKRGAGKCLQQVSRRIQTRTGTGMGMLSPLPKAAIDWSVFRAEGRARF
ncbi:MAG: hypothetical protein AAAB21_26130, partial [Pseudomonas chlororaphis]